MKRGVITNMTAGVVPDLVIVLDKPARYGRKTFYVDPFVSGAFEFPKRTVAQDLSDSDYYRRYVKENYIGRRVIIDTECNVYSGDGKTLLPEIGQIELLK